MSKTKSKAISFVDMHDELQSFDSISSDLDEMVNREKYSGINVDNNSKLRELVESWQEGIYDEDPQEISCVMNSI